MKASRLDRAIMAVSPRWGAARIRARFAAKAAQIAQERMEKRLQKAFDTADSDRIRGHRWMVSRLSPNDALDREWTEQVERCEQEYRTNSIAASAVNGRVDNVVGCGIRYQSRIRPGEALDRDADALNRRFEELHRRWAAVVQLALRQRQFERSKALYGEAFLVLSDDAQSPPEVPLVIDVIHPKRVETPSEEAGNKSVRLGIEFDARGRPVTYFIRRSHPDDSVGDVAFDRVPADRVCHSFEPLFPGQVRGIPWMTPVLPEIKDLKDFSEAHLIGEQVAACTTAWIKTPNPFQQAMGAAIAATSDGGRVEEMYPGAVEYIGPNDEVVFNNPNRPSANLAPYVESRLHLIAAGLRYPFELLAKAFTNNFSGGRLALIDGRITFRCWQHQSIDDCWTRVGRRFNEECVILGLVDVDPSSFVRDPEPWLRHAWIPPGWPWVDPLKEVNADTAAIAGHLSTETKSLAGRGEDLEETVEERTRERVLHLEADAKVERRRQELAAELGDDGFGRPAAAEPAEADVEAEEAEEVAA